MRILIILFLLLPAVYSFSADIPTVKQIEGKVEVKNSSSEWIKAEKGMQIPPGTSVSTGFKSIAVIELDNSEIIIKQLSRMSIDKLLREKNTVKTNLNLKLGRIRANVKTSKGLRHDFTIRTPVSTAAVRGTKFNAGVGKLSVESGTISYTNKLGQKVTIKEGNKSSVTGGGYKPPEDAGSSMLSDFTVSSSTQPEETTVLSNSGVQEKYGSIELIFTWSMPDIRLRR